jgi:hypothetical protein
MTSIGGHGQGGAQDDPGGEQAEEERGVAEATAAAIGGTGPRSCHRAT